MNAPFRNRPWAMALAGLLSISVIGSVIPGQPQLLQLAHAESAPAETPARTYEDGATVYVPAEWETGKTLHIHGEKWFTTDGKPSIIAVKLDMGGVRRKDDKYENNTIWETINVAADGTFSFDVPWPTTENSDIDAAKWAEGTAHNLVLLTGSIAQNDRMRGKKARDGIKIVPPRAPEVKLAQDTITPGTNLDVTLANFPPSDLGAYVFQLDQGNVRLPFEQPQKDFAEVDAGMLDLYNQFFKNGAGQLQIALPADITPGQHTLTVLNSLDENPSYKKDLTFTVTAPATSTPTTTPTTSAPAPSGPEVKLAQDTIAPGTNLDVTLANFPPSDLGAYVFQLDQGNVRLPFEQPQKDFAEVDAGMLDLYNQFFKNGAGQLQIALPADITPGQHTLTVLNSLDENPSYKKDLPFTVTGSTSTSTTTTTTAPTSTSATPTSTPTSTEPTTTAPTTSAAPTTTAPSYPIRNKFSIINHRVHAGDLLNLKGEGFAQRGANGYFAFKINRGSIPFVDMGGDITDLDAGAAYVAKHLPDAESGSWTASIILPKDLKPGKYTINLLAGNDLVGPKLSVSDEIEVIAEETPTTSATPTSTVEQTTSATSTSSAEPTTTVTTTSAEPTSTSVTTTPVTTTTAEPTTSVVTTSTEPTTSATSTTFAEPTNTVTTTSAEPTSTVQPTTPVTSTTSAEQTSTVQPTTSVTSTSSAAPTTSETPAQTVAKGKSVLIDNVKADATQSVTLEVTDDAGHKVEGLEPHVDPVTGAITILTKGAGKSGRLHVRVLLNGIEMAALALTITEPEPTSAATTTSASASAPTTVTTKPSVTTTSKPSVTAVTTTPSVTAVTTTPQVTTVRTTPSVAAVPTVTATPSAVTTTAQPTQPAQPTQKADGDGSSQASARMGLANFDYMLLVVIVPLVALLGITGIVAWLGGFIPGIPAVKAANQEQ